MAFISSTARSGGGVDYLVTHPSNNSTRSHRSRNGAFIAENEANDVRNTHCRSCRSPSLVTDWAAGDVVCTNCGLVHEEHIVDSSPEWREFHESDDLAKGLPSAARSGLVPVDESKYLGGLQPTTLSKHIFGGGSSSTVAPRSTCISAAFQQATTASTRRKRLLATNHKMDILMMKQHARALKNAQLSRKLRLATNRRSMNNEPGNDGEWQEETTQPECHDRVLLHEDDNENDEQEDEQRLNNVLYAEKWSMERAILLHGNAEDTTFTTTHMTSLATSNHGEEQQQEEERQDLLKRLDKPLLKASQEMYTAYIMLLEAWRKLHLPHKVLHEATAVLCQYAAQKDGIIVKGVSSRLSSSKSKNVKNGTTTHHDANINNDNDKEDAVERLRTFNKLKQTGALGAALLFLTARQLGWTRSLTEVCSSVVPPSHNGNNSSSKDFIKPKHCSKAMKEVHAIFPHQYGRPSPLAAATRTETTMTNTTIRIGLDDSDDSVARFVEHATRKLELPPVAQSCICTLTQYYQTQERQQAEPTESATSSMSNNSVAKLSTICASVTMFVCLAGASLQRLAQQAQSDDCCNHSTTCSGKRHMSERDKPNKRIKAEAIDSSNSNDHSSHESSSSSAAATSSGGEKSMLLSRLFDEDATPMATNDVNTLNTPPPLPSPPDEPFDVFSHSAVQYEEAERKRYEMRRIWDAWSEQMPWYRNTSRIEQSCGVSKSTVVQFYKSKLYPIRQTLLEVLQISTRAAGGASESSYGVKTSSSSDAPMASLLLKNIAAAAPLLNSKGQL